MVNEKNRLRNPPARFCPRFRRPNHRTIVILGTGPRARIGRPAAFCSLRFLLPTLSRPGHWIWSPLQC